MDGTPFGHYRLHEVLGNGGMGQVYRAFDTTSDRMVALKVLRPEFAADGEYQERFRREAQAAAKLQEPHVIPIHRYGEIDGRLYIDMPLVKGTDVESIIGSSGPMPPARAVAIIAQAAAALDAAHAHGLVHRDVKPANLLVAARDFVYLIDFGIADVAGSTPLTRTGAAIGTYAYMAPERFTTGRADARADVYSLACVLSECLTGQRPFPGNSLEQQYHGHVSLPPPRPSHISSGVSEQFDKVIARGMAKDPGQRFATAGQLAAAAEQARTAGAHTTIDTSGGAGFDAGRYAETRVNQSAPAMAAPARSQYSPVPSESSSGRKRLLVATGIVIVVVAAAAVGWFASRGPNSDGNTQSRASSAIGAGTKESESAPSAHETVAAPPPVQSSAGPTAPLPPPPAPRSNAELDVGVPMTYPACDHSGIVVLANAVAPGQYATEIRSFLAQYPGSSYLRTDQSCPSLRQATAEGNAIYTVYRPAGRTVQSICAAVASAGGDAYGKWLDTTTDPASSVTC